MYPSGIIYHIYNSEKSGPHGSANLHASRATKIAYTFARGFGAGLIGFIIIAAIFTFGPLVKNELGYDLSIHPSQVDLINAQNTSAIQQEAQNFGVSSYFSIVIPKINAHANIIANVDAGNQKEYDEALQEGVAQAKGTYFPGQGKTIFLFAHSTNSPLNVAKYNAVFYLLDKMQTGDQIIVYFADQRYVYKVSETKIIGPNDTSYLSYNDGSETLILQTCYPPGTSWNRLLVLAKPV
ncbi:MAG TPA: sortase [Patescibacteria group bacterium]|nr:sortase [Patescibacteria group bacterium]